MLRIQKAWWRGQIPRNSRPGSLLIDVLLAIVIFGVVAAALSTGILQSQRGSSAGSNRIRAAFLAEEGLEAIRSVRNSPNGFATIFSKTLGQNYGVILAGNRWSITNSPTTVENVFNRAISFAAGTNSNERLVTSTVTWKETGSTQSGSIALTTYVANWHEDPPPPPPDWAQPQIKSSVSESTLAAQFAKVAVANNYAFIADEGGTYGVHMYNVTDLDSAPVDAGDVPGTGYAKDIVISGNYAYVATNNAASEIQIINVSAPPGSATCSPCAGTIDLADVGLAQGLAITGTGLFIARNGSSGPEVVVYDIGDSPTAPTMVSSYESDPNTDNAYAITATGSTSKPNFAYVAFGTSTDDELRVLNVTGATAVQTGNAGAGANLQGTAIAIYNTGAYIGASGGDACEIFAVNIAGKVHHPNQAPPCGGNLAYDVGGDSDASSNPNDFSVARSLGHLQIAASAVTSGVNYFLHILDVNDVRDINSASRKIYTGGPPNVTAGRYVQNGIFYRESDHTIFMVGGTAWVTASDLLILQPKYAYQ